MEDSRDPEGSRIRLLLAHVALGMGDEELASFYGSLEESPTAEKATDAPAEFTVPPREMQKLERRALDIELSTGAPPDARKATPQFSTSAAKMRVTDGDTRVLLRAMRQIGRTREIPPEEVEKLAASAVSP